MLARIILYYFYGVKILMLIFELPYYFAYFYEMYAN